MQLKKVEWRQFVAFYKPVHDLYRVYVRNVNCGMVEICNYDHNNLVVTMTTLYSFTVVELLQLTEFCNSISSHKNA